MRKKHKIISTIVGCLCLIVLVEMAVLFLANMDQNLYKADVAEASYAEFFEGLSSSAYEDDDDRAIGFIWNPRAGGAYAQVSLPPSGASVSSGASSSWGWGALVIPAGLAAAGFSLDAGGGSGGSSDVPTDSVDQLKIAQNKVKLLNNLPSPQVSTSGSGGNGQNNDAYDEHGGNEGDKQEQSGQSQNGEYEQTQEVITELTRLTSGDVDTHAVPEPASLVLMVGGLTALAFGRKLI